MRWRLQVREDGTHEIMATRKALLEATQAGLDLVMISDKADPPICK